MIVGSLTDLSKAELRSHFPQITAADVDAAILYAAEASRNTLVA